MAKKSNSKNDRHSSNKKPVKSTSSSHNTNEFKISTGSNPNFSLLNNAYPHIIQKIITFLRDIDAIRLSLVNTELFEPVHNSPYGIIPHAITTSENDESKTSSSIMILGKFASLKQTVFKNNEILQNLKKMKYPGPELTFTRVAYKLTPNTFRQTYSIAGAITGGLYANTWIVSKMNTWVHNSLGGSLASDILCGAFIALFGYGFSTIFGKFLGGKVGQFCANDAYGGNTLGTAIGIISGVTTGLYYGVKNIINDYGLLSDVSFKLIEDSTLNYIVAGTILVSVCGLYANKKYHDRTDERISARKEKASQELNDAKIDLKNFARLK